MDVLADTKVRRKTTFLQWHSKGTQMNYGIRFQSDDDATTVTTHLIHIIPADAAQFENMMARAVQTAVERLGMSAKEAEAASRLDQLSRVCAARHPIPSHPIPSHPIPSHPIPNSLVAVA